MTLLPTLNNRNHGRLSLFDSIDEFLGVPTWIPSKKNLFLADDFDFSTDQSFDWKENPDSYTLKTNIPGFKLSEIDVDFNEGKLAISAESKRAGYENKFYKEIYVSNFERVDSERATAKLEDGVLQITLPKSEKTKGRKIVVQ